MSLTVFVHTTNNLVTVLHWFLGPSGAVDYACGPLRSFKPARFRQTGFAFVRGHFARYSRYRLRAGEQPARVFATRKEKGFIAEQRAMRIDEHPAGTLILIPLEVQKLGLNGLVPLPERYERTVRLDATAAEFWKAFDEVLAACRRSVKLTN